MILGLIAAILIVGIALLQLREGLFSALIFTVATIFAAAGSLGCYQAIAVSAGLLDQSPALAGGLCMGVLFVILLYTLRLLLDRLIGGDIIFGLWVNRIGAITLGLISGTLIVGMLILVMQMLPFGRNVLGIYEPFGPDLRRQSSLSPIPADQITLGLGEMLSAGSLSTGEVFSRHHPDLLLESFCRRNTAGLHGRIDTEPDAMKVLGVYTAQPEDISGEIPANPLLDTVHGEPQILVIRVSINASASGDDDWWRLPGTQFRLVCDCDPLAPIDLYPVGYLYTSLMRREWKLHPAETKDGQLDLAGLAVVRPLDAARYLRSEKLSEDKINLVVDWVFTIPQDSTPQRLIFRGTDQADLPPAKPFADQPIQMRVKTLTPEPSAKSRSRRPEPPRKDPPADSSHRKGKGAGALIPADPEPQE
jgi:hypothetical protein